jgi:tryptophan-rich sensory protein
MNFVILFIWIVVAFLPGVFGQLATQPQIMTWYATLVRPPFAPPNWLFGPVWTLLYLSMGIAASLVWAKGIEEKEVKFAISLFLLQLVLNGLWSFIFFAWHRLDIAFIEIVFLWCLILFTILKFHRISRPAALLLVPYWLWVSFASVLNFSFWWLNK